MDTANHEYNDHALSLLALLLHGQLSFFYSRQYMRNLIVTHLVATSNHKRRYKARLVEIKVY